MLRLAEVKGKVLSLHDGFHLDVAEVEPIPRHCPVNGTKPRFSPKRQESCDSSTDARHLSPIDKSPGSEESMMNVLEMMTTDSEQVLNGTVN